MLKKQLAILSTPLPFWEGLGVVFFLFAWNTRILARGADPFGDVNIYKYQGNMTITAQVQQNGNVVTDAIVAVYCEDELRGKERVGSGTNPNLSYLTVFGEYTGHYDYLHFKVYTNGMTYTVTPSPAIPFTFNGSIGTEFEPYVITLPVSFANSADNSLVLSTYNGQTCDVVLAGRTLYKDGAWNTLCLPFALDSFTGTPLEGAIVKTLGNSAACNTGFDAATGTLTLDFVDADRIESGVAYIVKWEIGENITNPVFTGVTVENEAPVDHSITSQDGTVSFTGSYNPVIISGEDKGMLYFGSNNKIYYPNAAMQIGSCRAVFQLDGGITAPVRNFVLNFGEENDADGIGSIQYPQFRFQNEDDAIFNLAGQRLSKLQKGFNIVNGKKILK